MRLPSAAAGLGFVLLAACGPGGPQATVSAEQLEAAIGAAQAPLVVVLWADWSRAAVEMMPTAAELAQEYEGAGVIFYTVSLGRPPGNDVERVLEGFPAGSRRFTLEEDPAMTLAKLGVRDIPAALLYAPGGELRMTLDSLEGAPLEPVDLADAIDALVGRRLP